MDAQIITKRAASPIFGRVAERDMSAVRECIDSYGSLVWTLARKFTTSRAKAEEVTEEIFNDIWLHCESVGHARPADEKFTVVRIALKRLLALNLPADRKSI